MEGADYKQKQLIYYLFIISLESQKTNNNNKKDVFCINIQLKYLFNVLKQNADTLLCLLMLNRMLK